MLFNGHSFRTSTVAACFHGLLQLSNLQVIQVSQNFPVRILNVQAAVFLLDPAYAI